MQVFKTTNTRLIENVFKLRGDRNEMRKQFAIIMYTLDATNAFKKQIATKFCD